MKILDSPWRDLRAGLFYTHTPLPPTFMFVVDGLVGPAEPGELCFFDSLKGFLEVLALEFFLNKYLRERWIKMDNFS